MKEYDGAEQTTDEYDGAEQTTDEYDGAEQTTDEYDGAEETTDEYDGAEQTTDVNGMHNFRAVPCFRSIMGPAVVRGPGMNFEHLIRLVLTSMMNITVPKTPRVLSPSVEADSVRLLY